MTAREGDGGLGHALTLLAEHGRQISELRDLADAIAARLTELTAAPAGGALPYAPIPAPLWWRLSDDERREAAGRLASWVEAVYRPSHGHLAARLPVCWAEHPFCLFMLDWLCELHSLLYLQPRRTGPMLSGQAEWQARLLPAAADLMAREAAACSHRRNWR
jgi:hypothetical protein